MPKRPGQEMREAFERRKKLDMEEYFESLQIVDVAFVVVDSKLLGRYEEQRIKKVYISPNRYKIYEI